MSGRNYIKNTVILFISMAITKIVGALFKIPLANLLGGTGMGYFSTAYGLYSPVFALTAAGVPTVIMRITAQSLAAGRNEYAAAVKKTALLLFSVIGLVGTAAVMIFAEPFAEHIACSPESTPALMCIAPAVMLCCTASVLRGYYEGMSDVMPSAAASVAEATSRAVFGLAAAYAVLYRARTCLESGNSFFGMTLVSTDDALPLAAAGAVLAVSISELCGLITLVLSDKKHSRLCSPCRAAFSRRDICSRLLKDTVPIAASALVVNCVSFVDLLTVTRTLTGSMRENNAYFADRFSDILPYCGGLDGLPNFMYGSYTGIAMSLFMLIPSFAGMTEKTSSPAIAAAWEKNDPKMLSESIFTQLRACSLIGCPACFGAAVLAEPILRMLYSSRAAEVTVCLQSFVILCLGGIFMVLSGAMFGIFQAIGRSYIPLVLMICSVAVKLLLNPLLISVPRFNIAGAALSSIIGYFIMTAGGCAALKRVLPTKTRILSAVLPPVLCGAACAGAALFCSKVLLSSANNTVNVIFSIAAGVFIYGILLIITGNFRICGIIKRKIKKNFKNPLKNK
ncbi:MAG: polysaccharide biosynthesis C-terminal domain-containing protein [Oscillospiraceae bacterium]